MGQDPRVQSVGLGQRSGGPGEVPDLPWVDHHHRQRRSGQGGHQGQLQAARSLQQHQGGPQVHYLRDQSLNSGLVVGQGPSLPRRPDSNVQLRF